MERLRSTKLLRNQTRPKNPGVAQSRFISTSSGVWTKHYRRIMRFGRMNQRAACLCYYLPSEPCRRGDASHPRGFTVHRRDKAVNPSTESPDSLLHSFVPRRRRKQPEVPNATGTGTANSGTHRSQPAGSAGRQAERIALHCFHLPCPPRRGRSRGGSHFQVNSKYARARLDVVFPPCTPRHDAAADPPSTRAPRAPTRNAGSRAAGGGQPVAVAPGPHPACRSKRRPLPHALVPGPPPPRRRRQDAPLLRAAQRRPPGDAGRPRAPLPGRRARHPRPARARLSRPPPHATLTRWHHGRRPEVRAGRGRQVRRHLRRR
jgi:hypothetical protein